MTVAAAAKEREDAYPRVVARLNDRWRVIVCKDGMQWILQRRDNPEAHTPRWRGKHYCRTREALLRLCVALGEDCQPDALAELRALPENFGRAA